MSQMSQAPSSPEKAETLDATIAYLEGLPTGVETESAEESVDAWIATLKADGRSELTAVADELQNLLELLSASQLDGKAIGKTMITLGDLTRQTVSMAEKPIADRLLKLAEWLTKSGQAM